METALESLQSETRLKKTKNETGQFHPSHTSYGMKTNSPVVYFRCFVRQWVKWHTFDVMSFTVIVDFKPCVKRQLNCLTGCTVSFKGQRNVSRKFNPISQTAVLLVH